eukprot:GILK01010808.1.p1 GENE.GILK01010808.1~~GILK01010808.1.p1  ORF type:complete len:222 (-),score=9.85 GILK01010808.1:70-735(-)
MTTSIDLFYDVVSPYSWFAFETLIRLEEAWGFKLNLRPMFLGGIMKGSGNTPPAMLPARGAYLSKDTARCAEYFGLTLKNPEDISFLFNSLPPMRLVMAVALRFPSQLIKISREMWSRGWSRGLQLADEESLRQACQAVGFTESQMAELFADMQSPSVKAALVANTQAALDLGAFGAPWIVVHVAGREPETFFGSDRFHLIARLLGKQFIEPALSPLQAKL